MSAVFLGMVFEKLLVSRNDLSAIAQAHSETRKVIDGAFVVELYPFLSASGCTSLVDTYGEARRDILARNACADGMDPGSSTTETEAGYIIRKLEPNCHPSVPCVSLGQHFSA